MRILRRSCGTAITCITLAATVSAQPGPQTVVREFCRLDAMGARASLPGWFLVAPLVQWEYEPAWDHVTLVTSYTVGWPVPSGEEGFEVEVRYAVSGEVSSAGLVAGSRIESRLFRVEPGPDMTWRIAGPPPPPHVFATEVDTKRMQESFQRGGANFLPNSLFVWQLFRNNGWEIPFENTSGLASSAVFRIVNEGKPGDLVLYLDHGRPYHVGVLEGEDTVVSATLNAGIVRTGVQAFAGEQRWLRLRSPELWPPTPTPTMAASTIEQLQRESQKTSKPVGTPQASSERQRKGASLSETFQRKKARWRHGR